MIQMHGTCVALDGEAVLFTGASGAGKSDLAVRMLDRGWDLVADDRVDIAREDSAMVASCPEPIRSKIEIRGVGIIHLPCVTQARLRLVIDLVAPQDVPRLPEKDVIRILDVDLTLLRLAPFEQSAPAKTDIALKTVTGQLGLEP